MRLGHDPLVGSPVPSAGYRPSSARSSERVLLLATKEEPIVLTENQPCLMTRSDMLVQQGRRRHETARFLESSRPQPCRFHHRGAGHCPVAGYFPRRPWRLVGG